MTQRARPILLVCDLQQGFINEHTQHLPKLIEDFGLSYHDHYELIFAELFTNDIGSPFWKFLNYEGMATGDDRRLAPELDRRIGPWEVSKGARYDGSSALLGLLKKLAEENRVSSETKELEVDVCGVDTEACVYATAIGLFDAGVRTRVLYYLCASSGGREIHEAMLPVMERTFGKDNIIMKSSERFQNEGGGDFDRWC